MFKSQSAAKKSIILVPGFKSSVLKDRDGEIVWISLSESLFGNTPLSLDNEAIGIKNTEFFATEVLKSIPVLPGVYKYEVHDKLLANLKEDFGKDTNIIEFPYDWRKDNIEAVKALAKLVKEEKKQGHSVTLLAHSMGGVIVSYYLRYGAADPFIAHENWDGAKKVDKVAFAGTPFQGSLTIFNDFEVGNQTLLNSNVLSAESFGSFPSSYQLLPYYDMTNPDALTKKEYFSPKWWEKNKWGLLKDETKWTPEVFKERKTFVAKQLVRAKKIYELVNAPLAIMPKAKTKLFNVIGSGQIIQSEIEWNDKKMKPDFENADKEDGDGVVLSRVAVLPPAYSKAFDDFSITVPATHGDLYSDSKSYELLKEFLENN